MRKPPLTAPSAIRRALARDGEQGIKDLIVTTEYGRTTVQLALGKLMSEGEVQLEAVDGRAPITYRLTRAGKARWREDEKYLKEGRA